MSYSNTLIEAGARLKQLRVANGDTRIEAAARAEPPLRPQYIYDIERGKAAFPQVDILPQIATAYGISVPEILGCYGIEISVAEGEAASSTDELRAMSIGRAVLELDSKPRQHILDIIKWLKNGETAHA